MTDTLKKAIFKIEDLFELYLKKNAHGDESAERLQEMYAEFAETPSEYFGYKSPLDALYEVDSNELKDLFIQAAREDGVSDLLLDRIVSAGRLNEIKQLVIDSSEDKVISEALRLVMNIDRDPSFYSLVLAERKSLESVMIASAVLEEIMSENPSEQLADVLVDIAVLHPDIALDVGDIVKYAPHTDKTYNFLSGLLKDAKSGIAVQTVCAMLARYGDQRAAALLYPLLDTCDYVAYADVRSAIEQLGGTVDPSYRDFSRDPLYKKVLEETEKALRNKLDDDDNDPLDEESDVEEI